MKIELATLYNLLFCQVNDPAKLCRIVFRQPQTTFKPMPVPLEICKMQGLQVIYTPAYFPHGELYGYRICYNCVPIVYEGPVFKRVKRVKRLRNVKLH